MEPVNYNKLAPEERREVRIQYIEDQKGLCAYCKESLRGSPPRDVSRKYVNKSLFPANFFNWPVHLHHDHDTGMTIGAVHAKCNAVLWQYHGE